MPIPFGVIAVYGALVVWTGLLLAGLKRGAFGSFLVFGIALLVVLNTRYAIERAPDSIAFFIAIYDVPDNFGASDPSSAAALAACPNNQCTVWVTCTNIILPGGSHFTNVSCMAAASAQICFTGISFSIRWRSS